MVREYGSPTLFLALSCAEYDSLDISTCLRKVNDVSDSYPTGKLCTEDPVSVSRKFSHDFFQTVILKGQVLGPVAHHFFKKDYQARGAPHYHILLWILWQVRMMMMWCCGGFRRGSLAVFLRKTATPSCINWSRSTSTTSATITVDGGNGLRALS